MANGRNTYLNEGAHIIQIGAPVSSFILYDKEGHIYHERDLPKGTRHICIHVLHPDNYTGSAPFIVKESKPLPPVDNDINLPLPERNRWKDITVVYNPHLEGTPARIYSLENPARIEIGDKFYTLPKQARFFILLHEYGHLFYATEWKVDLFALKVFLGCGFNPSQAFYALSKVLNRNPQSLERIYRIFKTLKDNNHVK